MKNSSRIFAFVLPVFLILLLRSVEILASGSNDSGHGADTGGHNIATTTTTTAAHGAGGHDSPTTHGTAAPSGGGHDTSATTQMSAHGGSDVKVKSSALFAFTDQQWTYENTNKWDGTCSNGSRQSPVELNLEDAVAKQKPDPLVLKNYKSPFPGKLFNDGRTVTWLIDSLPTSTLPTISGSALSGSAYYLEIMQFHWGSEDLDKMGFGSEHLVQYRPAPMEVHFVHRNSKYRNLTEAMDKSDGLAILAFLFTPVSKDAHVTLDYGSIDDKLESIVSPSTSVDVKVDMSKVMPSWAATGTYFRYDGSLTSPPCFESVAWTVFLDRIEIQIDDLNNFRKELKYNSPANHGAAQVLANNYRPVQLRNNRIVWTNGNGLGKVPSSSNCCRAVLPLVLASFIAVLALITK